MYIFVGIVKSLLESNSEILLQSIVDLILNKGKLKSLLEHG